MIVWTREKMCEGLRMMPTCHTIHDLPDYAFDERRDDLGEVMVYELVPVDSDRVREILAKKRHSLRIAEVRSRIATMRRRLSEDEAALQHLMENPPEEGNVR